MSIEAAYPADCGDKDRYAEAELITKAVNRTPFAKRSKCSLRVEGKIHGSALAQRLSLAPARLKSRIAAVRRVLNADRYPGCRMNMILGAVELNYEPLWKQFEV